MKIKINQSISFIGINIIVAFLGFVRSFAFIKFFDFNELGIITLVSTGAMLISFFQIGLINGGYRIIALQDKTSNEKVNNVIFSYIGILYLILIVLSAINIFLKIYSNTSIILLVITIGIFSLVTNWLTNTLIGAREYKRLNLANIISSLVSLGSLILAYYFGLIGALLSLLLQPLLFVVIVFITDKKTIPTAFDLDFKEIKKLLDVGFIPFLSGIFFLVYQQIERWSVNFYLGSEAIGKMYLVFLTTTLWVLIPTSLNNLFFPLAIKLSNDNLGLKKLIKKYFMLLMIYILISILIISFLFYPMIDLIFPNHLPYVKLVYLIIPALALRTLSDPIGLLLNSKLKLKPILISDLISTLIYTIIIIIMGIFKIFSLENVLICYGLYNLIKFTYLFISFRLLNKKLEI